MMSQWIEGTLKANGIRIHYHRTGGAKPPLVLSHGFSDNGLCWTRVARVLEEDYDVIMPDARGHGLSDAPPEGYRTEDRAADLAGFINELELVNPGLMGHSMGAATTALTAARYPELVGCIVLEDPPWFTPDSPWARERLHLTPEQEQAQIAQRRQAIAKRKTQTVEQIIADGQAASPTWHADEWLPWAESKRQHSENTVAAVRQPQTPWAEIVPGITCPALLVIGDPQERSIVTPEGAQQIQALNPLFSVVQLLGAGHNIRREQFEGYVQAVAAFLRENVTR